jgi:phospholipid/cholesterol/gamma-HCH transport system substrate-binding protein
VKQTRIEIFVGVFVLVGILCLGYLALRLGKLEVMGSKGYIVYADFSSVAGLKPGDPVEIAGVKVGRVEGVSLADDRARLSLRIDEGVKLPEDTIASVRSRGLIGDKFILLSPGASDKLLAQGGKIRETESPPDLTEVIGKYIGGDLTSKGGGEKGGGEKKCENAC